MPEQSTNLLAAEIRGAWTVWGQAARFVWAELPRLIALNLLWVALVWPLLPLGAATLTASAWLRRAVLEVAALDAVRAPDQPPPSPEPYRTLSALLRRLWWPGTLWGMVNAAALGLTLSHLAWAQAHPTGLGAAVQGALLLYLGWFWLAAQPFWLDALAEEVPPLRALGEAARIVLAYPVYAHLCALPPLLLAGLSLHFRTLWLLVGVGALLLFWACVATGTPRLTRARSQARDLY